MQPSKNYTIRLTIVKALSRALPLDTLKEDALTWVQQYNAIYPENKISFERLDRLPNRAGYRAVVIDVETGEELSATILRGYFAFRQGTLAGTIILSPHSDTPCVFYNLFTNTWTTHPIDGIPTEISVIPASI